MKNSKLKNPGIDLPSAFGRVASVALFVSVLSVGSVAQAAPIDLMRNTTDGLTVFQDSFESYTVTSSPLVKPSSASADGTWAGGSVFGNGGSGIAPEIGIVDQSESLDNVAPQEGSQFFQMSSVNPGGSDSAQSWTGTGILGNSTPGDTIETNIAFNLTSGSNEFFIYLWDEAALLGAFALQGTGPRGDNYSLMDEDGSGWAQTQTAGLTNVTFAPGVWNTFNVVYVNGASTMNVSINGTVATVSTLGGATGDMNRLSFNQTAASTVYFDAVIPEPSSILLMGLGALMTVIGLRRRKRR